MNFLTDTEPHLESCALAQSFNMEGIKEPPGGRPPPQEPPGDDRYTTEQLALIRAAMMVCSKIVSIHSAF